MILNIAELSQSRGNEVVIVNVNQPLQLYFFDTVIFYPLSSLTSRTEKRSLWTATVSDHRNACS